MRRILKRKRQKKNGPKDKNGEITDLSVPLGGVFPVSFSDTTPVGPSSSLTGPLWGRPPRCGSKPLPGLLCTHFRGRGSSHIIAAAPVTHRHHRGWRSSCPSPGLRIMFHSWFRAISIWKYVELGCKSNLAFISPLKIRSPVPTPVSFSVSVCPSVQSLSPPDSDLSGHQRLVWAGGNGDSVFKGSRVSVWEAEKAPEADGSATIKNNSTKQNKLSVILDPWLLNSLFRDLLCDQVVLMFHFVLQKFTSASITRRVISSQAPLPFSLGAGQGSALKAASPPTSSGWVAVLP